MSVERTLILIKPDGVAKKVVGEVVSRIERKGLTLVAMQLRTIDESTAAAHYAEHEGKPFYPDLIEFITSGPLVAIVAEGENAIAAFRQLAGATDPVKAETGSIRGDFATVMNRNIVHGSDSPENGEREAKIFFPDL
ncbi:nucleoside-diphosphate kinase [Blastococcus sp. Marseille-P5729]|uniref:nucleoside-diphosphate kinase n=1 Tax=Blastococcus sp. Marseille-P5729 TaxID=2086582 RepID=UPI000D0F595C|nr:nucleoside-diphosphate kinase [Blastococcus sp. Marseille-P5729]